MSSEISLALTETKTESGVNPQVWVTQHDSREELEGDLSGNNPPCKVLDWCPLDSVLALQGWTQSDLAILSATFEVVSDYADTPRPPMLSKNDLSVIVQEAFDMGRRYKG